MATTTPKRRKRLNTAVSKKLSYRVKSKSKSKQQTSTTTLKRRRKLTIAVPKKLNHKGKFKRKLKTKRFLISLRKERKLHLKPKRRKTKRRRKRQLTQGKCLSLTKSSKRTRSLLNSNKLKLLKRAKKKSLNGGFKTGISMV